MQKKYFTRPKNDFWYFFTSRGSNGPLWDAEISAWLGNKKNFHNNPRSLVQPRFSKDTKRFNLSLTSFLLSFMKIDFLLELFRPECAKGGIFRLPATVKVTKEKGLIYFFRAEGRNGNSTLYQRPQDSVF